ncbi:Cellulose synthase operon C protein [Sodalis praecaptivus]|uniref:Cellulose synthase operon C protein n=1 Tax=Sodalis praecaptivus TaxID=1239307 RepID=W0HQ89_9GAMM|nr:YaeQ family protein [Sodalis praecaptivus]AHF75996.1 Cellulose synthase operon C protein [Sodalis praecaptivus]
MALKATIHKATVNIADMDRHYYSEANLVLAQHPSETPQRLMLRLLAWLCHADDRLEFTRGLSAEDEPALWLRNDHGEAQWWIELGLPDEKRLRKACHQARQVVLYAYNARAARVWWQQNQPLLSTHGNLSVRFIDDGQLNALANLAQRNMVLQATLQEGLIWLSNADSQLEIAFEQWQ